MTGPAARPPTRRGFSRNLPEPTSDGSTLAQSSTWGGRLAGRRSDPGESCPGCFLLLALVSTVGSWIKSEWEDGNYAPAAVTTVIITCICALGALLTWLAREPRARPRSKNPPDTVAVVRPSHPAVDPLPPQFRPLQQRAQRPFPSSTQFHSMSPRQFEQAVASLCRRDGCNDARAVGGAGDLGADVIATTPDGQRVVIQCKRYGPKTKVGSPDLQRFGGTCFSVHKAHVAAVVTTSLFTTPARQYARQHGIILLDQRALSSWATRTGPAPWKM